MGDPGSARGPSLRAWALLAAAVLLAPAGAGAAAGTSPGRGLPTREAPVRRPVPLRPAPESVRFEPNLGQWDPRVRFLGRSPSCLVFLADGEAVFRLGGPGGGEGSFRPARDLPGMLRAAPPGGDLRMKFVGAAAGPRVVPSGLLGGVSHYFLGNDRARWRSGVPHYGAASYAGLWPGVDLVFRGGAAEGGAALLEYDLVLAPGADPDAVRFRFEGQSGMAVDGNGDLVLATGKGEVRQTAPRLWQESGGARRAVPGAFRILPDGTVGFETGRYDAALPLVVDPKVSYASYLGGTGSDTSQDVVVDSTGSILATGFTTSTDFPRQSAYQSTWAGASGLNDAYVTKYSTDGLSLVFSTYLGGAGIDEADGITVDGSNNVLVCGRTGSTDFPTASAYQGTYGGGTADLFLTKLNSGGSALSFSTFLGNTGQDECYHVAVDTSGIYVTGATNGTLFPTSAPIQAGFAGGASDALLLKFNPTATTLTYCTYFGGSGQDVAVSLAVDSSGNLYACGETSSADFPTLNAYQSTFGGSGTNPFPGDGFCLKLAANGQSVSFSTFLGGTSDDICENIALTAAGEPCLGGHTTSGNFPVSGAVQGTLGGSFDAFCTKLNASGTGLAFSTFFGGSGNEYTRGIGVDSGGNVIFCGITASANFPVQNAFQATYQGGTSVNNDGFIVRLAGTGGPVRYSSFLGGPGADDPRSMALDGSGNPVIVGLTDSVAFPVVAPQQATIGGGAYDTYVMKIVLSLPADPTGLSATLPGTGAVQVAWTDASNNEDNFEIERKGVVGPFVRIQVATLNAVQYQDFSVQPSTTYTYRVRAVNGDGASGYTGESTVTTPATVPPPTSPNNLVAAAQSITQVSLSWNDRAANENVYEVQRRPLPGAYAVAVTLPADSTAWIDNAVGPDTPLLYRVRAVGATAASAWSNEASASTPPTMTLDATKGSLTDSPIAGKDKAKVKGTYLFLPASPDGAMDPLNQGVTVYVGGEQDPAVIVIPPDDAGWKVRNGKATWKTPKESITKATVVLDLGKFKFSIAISKINFPAPPGNPMRVSLRVGNDAGSHRAAWDLKRTGVYSFKP